MFYRAVHILLQKPPGYILTAQQVFTQSSETFGSFRGEEAAVSSRELSNIFPFTFPSFIKGSFLLAHLLYA